MNTRYAHTISGRMAQYAASLRYEALPNDIRKLARLVLLDGIGCALVGSITPEIAQIRAAVVSAGGGGSTDAVLWGSHQKAPLALAVLANSAALHAREIDDFGGCAHSGAVVIPTALGMAARVNAGGRDLLTSIVIGYDIARRAMDGGGGYVAFKERGWHSTSTCGGFGAAAAAGRLLGLDAERMQWAIGYAGCNAGGTWAFIPEGAMSKRVHPGFAAQTGVMSAFLAANGVTAPATIFEAEWGGYYSSYMPGAVPMEDAVKDLGVDFRIRLVGFKPYAACQGIHSSLDVVLGMRREQGVRADDVARVTVRGSRTHVKQLAKQHVQTLLDAQMSLPYSIATALISGGAMLDQYTKEALLRPEVNDLALRVTVVHESSVANGEEPYVDVELTDGRLLSGRMRVARGDYTNPLSEIEVREKFRAVSGLVFSKDRVARIEEVVSNIEEMKDAGELISLLLPEESR